MTQIRLTSEIAVEEIQAVGHDQMIVHAARVSVRGNAQREDVEEKEAQGLIRYLMQNRHGTPFEHGCLTVRVHAPIKVWREWHRHRVGWCLAGDTEVWTETTGPNSGRTVRKRPIAELWRNWHQGVLDSMGRVRLLDSCRHLPLRVLNEETQLFETARAASCTSWSCAPQRPAQSGPASRCGRSSRQRLRWRRSSRPAGRSLTPPGTIAGGARRDPASPLARPGRRPRALLRPGPVPVRAVVRAPARATVEEVTLVRD